jgi:hypothetical protein
VARVEAGGAQVAAVDRRGPPMGQAVVAPLSLLHGLLPLVESETLVRAFSPNSTFEPGLKAFR